MNFFQFLFVLVFIFLGVAVLAVYAQMPAECSSVGITDPYKCEQYLLQQRMPQQCRDAGITDEAACTQYLTRLGTPVIQIPAQCSDAGIRDRVKCEEYLRQQYMPAPCRSAGVTDEKTCEQLIMKQAMPQECLAEGITERTACEVFIFKKIAPVPCVEKGLTDPADCDEYISKTVTPKECIASGITVNHDACIRFLSDKYGGADKIPPSSYPPACVNAGATTPDACQDVMMEKFMPKECRLRGLKTPGACRTFLTDKYLPKECVAAGQTSKEGCDGVMFRKFAPKECVNAGVTDEKSCRKFMTKLLAPDISCEGMKEDACTEQIERNHIGGIVATRGRYEELKTRTADPQVNVSALSSGNKDLEEMVPLTKGDTRLVVLKSEEKIILNIDDNIIQTAPIALMIDSDGDGLADDIEGRLGSDPVRSDTDGDGTDDGEETRQSKNPAGEGPLRAKLAPIDNAILEGKTLGHPRTAGVVAAELEVEKALFMDTTGAEESGRGGEFEFSGRGEPDSVITLYIYSELPVVVTVSTDKYGNWQYKMSEPMRKGEHEVYVVVNDKTGRVVKKSNPFSFLISEAQAFTGEQTAGDRGTGAAGRSLKIYAFAAGSVIILGLIGFFGYMGYRRKKDHEAAAV